MQDEQKVESLIVNSSCMGSEIILLVYRTSAVNSKPEEKFRLEKKLNCTLEKIEVEGDRSNKYKYFW